MKQEDARRQIRLLWSKRDRDRLTRLDVSTFYEELRRDHPELLKFKNPGDKYQIVMAWLRGYIVE